MNEVYATPRRRRRRRRARRSRSARLPSGALVEIEAIALAGRADARAPARRAVARMERRDRGARGLRRSLGLDAYLVGGAVRDELLGLESKDADFLVPGARQRRRCARRSRRHGRVEELVVAGRPVGVRLYPRERAIRALAPAGIEFAPPRRERSTGPGRHDFEIVVDPDGERRGRPRAPRLHRQRDRPAGSPTARSSTRSAAAPTSSARILRTVSPRSFAEDPLRLVRGLRFVSQLDLDPDERDARADARGGRRRSRSSRASASAAGSRPTAWGSSRSCCSAPSPRRRCGSRATPACWSRSCRSSRRRSASTRSRGPRADRRRAHLRRRPGCRRRRASRCACGSRRCSTTSASRSLGERDRGSRRAVGAAARGRRRLARAALPDRAARARRRDRPLPHLRARRRRRAERPAAPRTATATSLSARPARPPRGRPARQAASGPRDAAAARAARRVPRASSRRERTSPHRLADLAVDGSDLIALGYRPGPELGAALRGRCSTRSSTTRAATAARRCSRAREELLALVIRWQAPGPTVVAFTTREGGVSRGAFASLNLGGRRRRPGRGRREPAARLRRRSGSTPTGSPLNRQRHTADASTGRGRASRTRSATRSGRTSPALPLLALGADCVPIAIADDERAAGARGRPRRLARARRRRRRGGRRGARRRARAPR